MRDRSTATIREREQLLADAIKHVAGELRLVDVSILVRYVSQEQHGNLDDLVASSAELFFKPGTLRYGLRAELDLQWGIAPCISLDLEFCHQDVTVFFCLTLGSVTASVEVHAITISGASESAEENTERLRAALRDARLVRQHARDVERS